MKRYGRLLEVKTDENETVYCEGIISEANEINKEGLTFMDSYYIWMKLKDQDGLEYEEEYLNMSLSDFEVLYGNITDQLIEVKIKLVVSNV